LAIAFRGTPTYSPKEWRVNFECVMRKYDQFGQAGSMGLGVHEGFMGAYKCVAASINLWIWRSHSTRGTSRVFFTGHSLGAALATVAAFMAPPAFAPHWDVSFNLVTFGSPRVGDASFCAAVRGSIGACERLVHGEDMVPSLPLTYMGYEHVPGPVLLPQMPRPWADCFAARHIFDHIPTLYADRLWEVHSSTTPA
jgi:predicted lipase